MFVSGFTIVKNAVSADYPIVEAIQSILPLVDEMIVAIGDCNDNTLEHIQEINSPKIKIVHSTWDPNLREGGLVLSEETNKALKHINPKADWCFYIQADECVHEKYHETIKLAMKNNLDKSEILGLVFNYVHFYGNYNYVADSRKWYRREVRIIRNNSNVQSYKDAQGFRMNGKKIPSVLIDAEIFHYGWVKHPEKQMAKQIQARKLWHDDKFIKEKVATNEVFDYSQIDSLKPFDGTHPSVMKPRIEKINWNFTYDISSKKLSLKNKFLYWIEKNCGWRIGEFKNYTLR